MACGQLYRECFYRLSGNIPPEDVDIVDSKISVSSGEGNVGYALPSICVSFNSDSKVGGHNSAFAEAAGMKKSFEAGLRVSKALAVTAIDC